MTGGQGQVDKSQLDEDEREFVEWLTDATAGDPEVSSADVGERDDDADETILVVPSLSEAWRGGGTMSSDRWFRRSP